MKQHDMWVSGMKDFGGKSLPFILTDYAGQQIAIIKDKGWLSSNYSLIGSIDIDVSGKGLEEHVTKCTMEIAGDEQVFKGKCLFDDNLKDRLKFFIQLNDFSSFISAMKEASSIGVGAAKLEMEDPEFMLMFMLNGFSEAWAELQRM